MEQRFSMNLFQKFKAAKQENVENTHSPAFIAPGWIYPKSFHSEISVTNRNKFMIVGLPKSGNNWLQFLLSDALEIPIINMNENDKAGLFVTHAPLEQHLHRIDIGKAVYIYRDLRDIVVSFFHYAKSDFYRQKVDPSCYFTNITDFYFRYFLPRVMPHYQWQTHATEYFKSGIPVTSYESLLKNTEETLVNLFAQLGVETPDNLQELIHTHDFENYKKAGATGYTNWPSSFFRKGTSGQYQSELPSIVRQHIETNFDFLLEDFGYELTSEEK